MKKDIYIIKNTINDRVYIGQATDAAKRWLSHIYDAKYESAHKNAEKSFSVLHRAMMKYGIDKFHYEILEYQIENYDEREIYWIKTLNTIVPNGYNITPGGQGTGSGIEAPAATFKDNKTLMKCISEISSSEKSLSNIARKYGCSPDVIIAINNGTRYKQENLVYPIRNASNKYPVSLVKQIRYSLKYELDLSLHAIAKKYNVSPDQVSYINTGKIYYVDTDDYPLRKKRTHDYPKETINNIIDDIKNSPLSFAEIAKKYNVGRCAVTDLNRGRRYHNPNIAYPIRSTKDPRNQSRNAFLDIDEVREICEALQKGESAIALAKKYSVTKTTIYNINTGSCKKYALPEYNYPIRQFKDKHKKK